MIQEHPIVPVISDPNPTPAAETDSSEYIPPQLKEASLDLAEPILEVLTDPAR